MPQACCVPGCKSNYNSNYKITKQYVSLFNFPKDEEMKLKWLQCIARKNQVVTKNTAVCIKHFDEADIIKEKRLVVKGKEIIRPRKKMTLRKHAFPKIFPGHPSYLSTSNESIKMVPTEEKTQVCEPIAKETISEAERVVVGEEQVCEAKETTSEMGIKKEVAKSLKSKSTKGECNKNVKKAIKKRSHRRKGMPKNETIAKHCKFTNNELHLKRNFTNFETFLDVIKSEEFNGWSQFVKDDCVVFGYLITKPAPILQYSIVVNKYLELSAFKENIKVNLAGNKYPITINNINEIESVMSQLMLSRNVCVKTVDEHLLEVKSYLLKVGDYIEGKPDKQEKLKYILKKIEYLNKKKSSR